MGLEGGGFLYGSTGSNGLFSGPRIAYIYPGKVKIFEFQILNSKFQISNSKFRIPNFVLDMTFSRLEIRASLVYLVFVVPFSKQSDV